MTMLGQSQKETGPLGACSRIAVDRRVLIVTYHFPPSAASASFRMLGFARHLPAFGWDVGVLAAPTMPDQPADSSLSREIPSGTNVEYVPYPASGERWSHARRACLDYVGISDQAQWLNVAWAPCEKIVREQQPDAIITSGPPHCVHAIARRVKRRHDLVWVADLRDPWFSRRPKKATLRDSWFRREERMMMRQADVIVANAPGAAALLQQEFPAFHDKIVAIPNGYDADAFASINTIDANRQRIDIVHLGQVYGGRDIRPLIAAVSQLKSRRGASENPIHFSFFGQTDVQAKRLHELLDQDPCNESISIGQHLPYREALSVMVSADILLLLDSPGRRIGVPAKLYEYIGARRPILALAEPDSDVNWALQTSGARYRLASPADGDSIARALADLLVDLNSPPQETDHNARFTRRQMAMTLDNVLRDCIHGR